MSTPKAKIKRARRSLVISMQEIYKAMIRIDGLEMPDLEDSLSALEGITENIEEIEERLKIIENSY